MSTLAKTKLTLTHRHQETPDTVSFLFKSAELKDWRAGQFLHYTLPHQDPDERGIERYFTIASAPFEGHVQLTTRFAAHKGSSFKKALHALKAGDEIEADGLDGDFVVEDPLKSHVFIAGGIGVTPYRAMLLSLDHYASPLNVDLLYANRNEHFPFQAELEALTKKHPNFRIHYFAGAKRIDEDAIRAVVGDTGKPVFYISGPEPMVQAFDKMLKGMKTPATRIRTDYFPGYDWP